MGSMQDSKSLPAHAAPAFCEPRTCSNLSATSSNDPFTLVFCGLWDMLENSQAFVNLVAPANRIKWLGQKVDPRKDQITDSDRPQIRVDFGDPFAEIRAHHGNGPAQVPVEHRGGDRQAADRSTGTQRPGGFDRSGPVGDFRFPHRIQPGDQGPDVQRHCNSSTSVKPGTPSVSIDNARLQEGMVGWTAVWPYHTWLSFNVLQNLPTPAA